jgi:UDP-glucose 4-epimerase
MSFEEFSGKRVLVTGGLGFIGSNLAHARARAGAHVTIVDALIPQHGGDHYNLSGIHGEPRVVVANLLDVEKLTPVVSGQDFIFHLAGQVSHGDSMRDPELDLAVNCTATIKLLEACRYHNPQAVIVHTSTRQVYGRPQRLPVDESHPIDPVDVNGINKLASEYYHLLYSRAYDMKCTVLRLTNTYGPRQQIKNERQGMTGVFLYRALRGEKLRLFGSGRQLRDFNYVDDVVTALAAAALTPACFGRIFNLGANQRHSLLDFCAILQKLCNVEYEVVPFPADRKLIDIGDYYGSFELFQQASGWQPRIELEEGLERSVSYFNEHRAHYLQ